MSFLSSLEQLIGKAVGAKNMTTTGSAVNHTPLTPAQTQQYNAQIENDGARMFNQAHPGQVYQINQNSEFRPGELPSNFVHNAPNYIGYKPLQQQPTPVTNFNARLLGNFSPNTNVQGVQNPGLIPVQGSVGSVGSAYGLQPTSQQVLTGNPQQIRMN